MLMNNNNSTSYTQNNNTDLLKNQALSRPLISGFGGYHTANPSKKNPRPYTTINIKQIMEMAAKPSSVVKDNAQWMIPSTIGGAEARGHAYQRENGVFHGLWADADKVEGMTWADVVERFKRAMPGTLALLYASRSATEDEPKSRAIVPLAEGIPGCDYSMMAKIFNNRLEAAGLIPDRATERTGQLCYLPNRGEFYQYLIIEGEILNPAVCFAQEIQAEQARLGTEAAKRKARHQESLKKIQARIDSGQADPVEAFKAAYPVEIALERYRYTSRGGKWLSPMSESGNPGLSVKNGKWHSHHAGDSRIGQPAKNGGTWGDSFDLFAWYEHGGDFNQAVRCAGDMFCTTDPETNERITITKLNQRQHMRGQDAADDFRQATEVTGNQNKPDPWEQIIPLDAQEVDRIDPATLPGIIGEYAQAVARETETHLELEAGVLFVVLSACVQSRVKIQIKPGYSEPLTFWSVTPMPPATRKSQVLKRMTAPLTEWERRKRTEFEPLIKARRIERENTQARIKSLRTRYGKAKPDELKKISDEIFELENNLEPELVSPQVWAQDCTPENAGQIMGRNDERLTILAAEGGVLDTIGGRYSAGVANLDLFLQGYSGDAVKVNRTSRADIFLNNPALSLGLMPQPQVLQGIASKPEFKGRGFIGRPFYMMPESNLGNRTLDSEPIPEHIKIAYYQTIESLLEIQPIDYLDGTTEPHTLNLSPEAFEEWKDFYLTIERDLADSGRFEHCRDWAGKTPGRAARLAGLLHCAINPAEPWRHSVPLETMEKALDLTVVSISHALFAFNVMGADPAIESAGRVLHWVKRHKHQAFTKRQAFQALKGTFNRATMLDEPLNVLAERNYVRAIEPEKKLGRPSETFEINPAIHQGGGNGLA